MTAALRASPVGRLSENRKANRPRRSLVLPRYLLEGTPVQIEDFETIGDWTTVTGTVADDASVFLTGSHGLKLTSDGSSNQPAAIKATGGISVAAYVGRHWFLHVYAHDSACVGKTVGIWLCGEADLNPSLFQSSRNSIQQTGWNTLAFYPGIGASGWSSAGGQDFTTSVTHLQVRYFGNASGQNVTIDNLVTGFTPVPACIWAGDQGFPGHGKTWLPRMKAAGLRGNIGLDTGLGAGITAVQLREMQNAGWSINGMGRTHQNLVTVGGGGQAAVEAVIDECVADLEALGITAPDTLIYWTPNGAWDATVLAAMAASGIVFHRQALPQPNNNWGWVGNPLLGMYVTTVAGGTSASTVTAAIDTAASAKQVICLQVHGMGADGTGWPADRVQATINHLIRKQVPVITMRDFYLLQSGPVTVQVPW